MRVKAKLKRGIRKAYTLTVMGIVELAYKAASVFHDEDLLDSLMMKMCDIYEANSDYYVAYKIRNKYAKNENLIEMPSEIDKEVAIVVQGPLVLKDHFTLETVRLYGKLFPSAPVIVSTWDTEDKKELDLIEKEENCIVLRNHLPDNSGVLNINYQSKSTLEGILEAEKRGCKYVAKTRADWRMYQKGFLRFMVHMLEVFPCVKSSFDQNKRIMSMDICSREISTIFYPYFISDIFMFGDIRDMKNYWSTTPSERREMTKANVDTMLRENEWTWEKRIKEGALVEAKLSMDYLRRMTKEPVEISVDAYWRYLRDYFMIMPRSLGGGYWFKYRELRLNESADWGTCFKNDSMEHLLTYSFDFVSWLNLAFGDLQYPEEYKTMFKWRTYNYSNGKIAGNKPKRQ